MAQNITPEVYIPTRTRKAGLVECVKRSAAALRIQRYWQRARSQKRLEEHARRRELRLKARADESKEEKAVRCIARWWFDKRPPLNPRCPLSLVEWDSDEAEGKRTFRLVHENGRRTQYVADELARFYHCSQPAIPADPLTCRPLTPVEITQLDKVTGDDVTKRYGTMAARFLGSSPREQELAARRQADHDAVVDHLEDALQSHTQQATATIRVLARVTGAVLSDDDRDELLWHLSKVLTEYDHVGSQFIGFDAVAAAAFFNRQVKDELLRLKRHPPVPQIYRPLLCRMLTQMDWLAQRASERARLPTTPDTESPGASASS